MTRVSLKEAYDNKDVVAQIFAIKDTANGAEATANTANTTANEAKTHVDTVAVDVERAVNTANRASESAQESARVVAGYDARLTTAEDGVARNRSDIQTIDGEITDIYNDLTNVVRKVGDAGQVIQNGLTLRGTNRVSNTVVGELNDMIVNAKRLIEEIDAKLNAYAHMVRTSGDQTIAGVKTFENELHSHRGNYQRAVVAKTNSLATATTIPASQVGLFIASVVAEDGGQLAQITYERDSTGRSKAKLTLTSSTGNLYDFVLGEVA